MGWILPRRRKRAWRRLFYTETFRSKVSLIEKENVAPGDSNTPFFYEHSAFQAPMEDYLDTSTGSPHIIIVRGGYFSSSSIRKHWLAINPSCARSFGWKLSSDDLFAWADEEGNPMVKTIYWQYGNPSYKSRFGYETGEGWLVLASPRRPGSTPNCRPTIPSPGTYPGTNRSRPKEDCFGNNYTMTNPRIIQTGYVLNN